MPSAHIWNSNSKEVRLRIEFEDLKHTSHLDQQCQNSHQLNMTKDESTGFDDSLELEQSFNEPTVCGVNPCTHCQLCFHMW